MILLVCFFGILSDHNESIEFLYLTPVQAAPMRLESGYTLKEQHCANKLGERPDAAYIEPVKE